MLHNSYTTVAASFRCNMISFFLLLKSFFLEVDSEVVTTCATNNMSIFDAKNLINNLERKIY